MSNRIKNTRTTSEAAYNYGNAFRDAIHSLGEALGWLEDIATPSDYPNALRGDDKDREWAKAKIPQMRDLIKSANFVKFGREGVWQA